jgi:hypothetical protein
MSHLHYCLQVWPVEGTKQSLLQHACTERHRAASQTVPGHMLAHVPRLLGCFQGCAGLICAYLAEHHCMEHNRIGKHRNDCNQSSIR